MAEVQVQVEDLIAAYEAEIGRMSSQLIQQRLSYEAQIKELTNSFAQSQETSKK